MEEAQNWMDCSFLFDKIPLYEFSRFNKGESDFRFKEDINSKTIWTISELLNNLNVNKNEILEDSEYINANSREKSIFFKVTTKNKKLGRKRKIEIENFTDTGHDKYHPDNMKTKIQVHFISFIFIFVNVVLRILGYKEQFDKIDYSLKKKC